MHIIVVFVLHVLLTLPLARRDKKKKQHIKFITFIHCILEIDKIDF
jgi:hypothetical protein